MHHTRGRPFEANGVDRGSFEDGPQLISSLIPGQSTLQPLDDRNSGPRIDDQRQ